jgi:hypothetical protein
MTAQNPRSSLDNKWNYCTMMHFAIRSGPKLYQNVTLSGLTQSILRICRLCICRTRHCHALEIRMTIVSRRSILDTNICRKVVKVALYNSCDVDKLSHIWICVSQVLQSRNMFRPHRMLGSFKLDVGTAWAQPGIYYWTSKDKTSHLRHISCTFQCIVYYRTDLT